MPKKFIRKYLPDHHTIREHRSLQIFGTLLHDPNLWHLNRKSVSMACAAGLFLMWVPLPLQMVLAAAVAIMVRSNLPITVVLVWITNPLTMGPMFYVAYKFGALLLQVPHRRFHIELSLDWLMTEMVIIWKPFLLGCFVFACISAAIGFFGSRLLWRMHIVRYIKQKKQKLANKLIP